MKISKLIGVLVLMLALAGATFAAAAALPVEGGVIQAGEDVNLQCDPDGVNVDGWGLESDSGLVNFVRIWNINGACEGDDLFVNITQGGTTIAQGSATIPADGAAGDNQPLAGQIGVKVTFPAQNASAITDIEVFIEGP
ncbi:MAG: hypothetical protein Q8R28_05045 [Dehalococcoidia bacterium]|nr:hypothetical protein [Dehalococcoidia bacterium]